MGKKCNSDKKNELPKGSIIMWNGNKIHHGWKLYDRKKNTPNLIDKFILGGLSVGEIGGNSTQYLTVDNLPHIHMSMFMNKMLMFN